MLLIIGLISQQKKYDKYDYDEITKEHGEVTLEYGSTKFNKVVTRYYCYALNTLNTDDFISEEVNKYIESERNSVLDYYRKDVTFFQTLNTYKANDNIVSVEVIITVIVDTPEKSIYTYSKCFNYDLKETKKLSITDIFDSRVEEKLKDIYSNNFILKEKEIIFCNSNQKYPVLYKSLKEYNCSFVLNANNYDMTIEEYNNLFSE